jgi:hypothetical protein
MSEGNASTSDYNQIFAPAIDKYKTLTGQDLKTNLVNFKLDKVKSTHDILGVFQQRMQNFDESRDGNLNEGLMTWLESVVNLLITVSARLGESTSEVSRRSLVPSASLLQRLVHRHIPRLE